VTLELCGGKKTTPERTDSVNMTIVKSRVFIVAQSFLVISLDSGAALLSWQKGESKRSGSPIPSSVQLDKEHEIQSRSICFVMVSRLPKMSEMDVMASSKRDGGESNSNVRTVAVKRDIEAMDALIGEADMDWSIRATGDVSCANVNVELSLQSVSKKSLIPGWIFGWLESMLQMLKAIRGRSRS